MRKSIISILLCLAGGGLAHAEQTMLAKAGEDTIRLSDRPCTHAGTLIHIPPEHRAVFRMARATLAGKDWYGCFAVRIDGVVLIVFEDGEIAEVPIAAFRAEPGV